MGNISFPDKIIKNTQLTLFLSTLLALTVLIIPPSWVSNLPICTDSVEYAIGAENIAETGRFVIRIHGEELPSRYPPWFSSIALAPAYLLFGKELGNAIIPITLFSIIGVISAFLIGYRLSGKWGGFISSLVLILLPAYRAYSSHVMTEVPCSALAILLSLIYMEIWTTGSKETPEAQANIDQKESNGSPCELPSKKESKSSFTPLIGNRTFSAKMDNIHLFVFSGIIAGIASAFRPACSAFILPFLLFCFTRKPVTLLPGRLLALIIPQFIVSGATIIYNLRVFGSISKTGYHFWCPVLFSNIHSIISPAFFKANLTELFISGLPALVLAVTCLLVIHIRGKKDFPDGKRDKTAALVYYLIIGTGPIVLLHLFYFWYDQRFYLPSLAVLAALAGGLIGHFFENVSTRRLLGIQVFLLIAALIFRLVHTPTHLTRRETAERIIRVTPPHALIISGIDPAYLEYFVCRNSKRRILPISRNVDYTSTAVTWRISMTTWTNAGNMIARNETPAGLYPYVAEECFDILTNEVRKGTPVFMDASQILEVDSKVVKIISENFKLARKAEYLYELGLK